MADLSLAESLLLIALDDEKGTDDAAYSSEPPLAGALLFDLIDTGHLRESDGVFLVEPGPPPAAPAAAKALEAIRGEATPRDAKHWVDQLPKSLKPITGAVAEGLVARGVLEERRHKVLGLFPTTRYPEVDPGPEGVLRAELVRVLLHDGEPDRRTAFLIALMRPTRLISGAVPKDRRKQAEQRAEAVAESGVVGTAVGEAISAIEAAILAAVVTSTIATTVIVTS